MNKNIAYLWRTSFYILGIIILSIGLTLSAKSGLGMAPVISIPFAIANVLDLNFALITFIAYISFIVIQALINRDHKKWKYILQVPFTLFFSTMLDIFGNILNFQYPNLWQNLILLFFGMIATAIGVPMIANMKIILNPADGLALSFGYLLKKDLGFGKNVLDITCVIITSTIGLVFAGKIIGIGIGTLIAMIVVGRIISIFNRIFKDKMDRLAGLKVENSDVRMNNIV